jgi:putative PIN family toxin of toxin-antitoxin system
MQVVIDTNVLVSGILRPHSKPGHIVSLMQHARIVPLVNVAIIAELGRVLRYTKLRALHRLSDDEIDEFLFLYRRIASLVPDDEVFVPTSALRDPTDHMYLRCAVAGGAQAIVSGDEDLLVLGSCAGIPIVNPDRFIRLLGQDTP